MAFFLGLDTSNYTSSVALYDSDENKIFMRKRLLPVKENELGLRQSEAVFAHIKQLHLLVEELFSQLPNPSINSVCASTTPRSVEGSYMPAFLVGEMAACSIASVLGVPKYACSHQEGHIVAALHSAGGMSMLNAPFYAFHLSGGTTECVSVTPSERLFEAELIAETLDIAAGQLIDRVGVMLGLSFPCGKELTDLALLCDEKIKLTPTMKGANIHFSGVQNQCAKLYKDGADKSYVARYAIEYIKLALDKMTEQILHKNGRKPLVYAGGVMSNVIIREHIEQKYGGIFASPEFSTDNAAGVAIIAMLKNAKR